MNRHATGTDPGSRSAAEIEREVQQSRAEIEQTLDAIQERLSPGQLVDQALGYLRGGRGVDFVRNLGDSIAQNPVPVTLMGVGLAWMMFGGQRFGREGDRGESAYWDRRESGYWEEDLESVDEDVEPVEAHYAGFAEEDMAYMGPEADPGTGLGEDLSGTGATTEGRMGQLGDQARRAGEQARHAATRAGEQARHAATRAGERFGRARTGMARRAHDVGARAGYQGRRAKEGLLRSIHEQPLVLGAIGLAIGAALGAALPPTRTEDELMGEARDKALRRATKTGREQAERMREAAGAVASAARDEAERQVSRSSSSDEPGGQTSGQSAETVGAREAGESRSAGPAADTPYPVDPRASLDRP
jgi:hypothetical protein